jgi:MFS family permease
LYLVHLGFDAAGIGRLLAVAQICFGLAALPAGVIGARLGPRTGLIAATVLAAAGWVLFLLAESMPADWLNIGLYAGLAVYFTGTAAMVVNGSPYLMSITDDFNRFYYLSFQQAIQALLGLIGGFMAGWLPGLLAASAGDGRIDADFYRSVLWLIPAGFILACFFLMRARQTYLHVSAHAGADAAGRSARLPLGVFAVYMLIVYLTILGDNGSRTFFNLYLDDMGLDTRQIGLMYGFNQLAPILTALAIPAVLRRMGTGKTYGTGALLLAVVLLFLSFSSGLAGATIGFFLMALMSTVIQATRSLFGQELVEARWRTFIASTGTISMSLGSASSAILGGYIIPNLGFPSLFLTSAVLLCLSGLLTIAYLKSHAFIKGQQIQEIRSTTSP